MNIFIQIITCILSCTGYYFIHKNPRYSYIVFIILNIILFITTEQYVMLLNIGFGSYFLIKIIYGKSK